MAFPVVAATATSQSTTNVSSHTLVVPSGAGELFVAAFACDGSETITWPSPWSSNILFNLADGAGTPSSTVSVAFNRTAGSLSNFIVTTGTNERSRHAVWRLTGVHASTDPEVATTQHGSTTTPDPPNLAPSWGAEDNLWIVGSGRDGSQTVSVYPETDNQVDNASGSSQGAGISLCSANANASSRNPGTFTISGNEAGVAFTIAVRPAGGVAPARRIFVT